jgi:uncharacterized protein
VDTLRPVIDRIVARMRPEQIWLFGSRAGGGARPGSDYDLLIVLPDGAEESDLDPVRVWSIVRGLGVPIDLIPCTRSEFEEEKGEVDTLPRAAVQHGRLVYERAA